MDKYKRLSRELVNKGAIIDLYKDKVQIPNGNIAEWDFIGHKGAAAVVPIMENGKILMVKQYRNALDRFTLEIPAGGRDSVYEKTIDCAFRELEEETGYQSKKLDFLISVATTVAFCDEIIDVYVATDLKPSKQHLDEDEFIEVGEYSIDDLTDKIFAGEIQDAKTISAILAYKDKYL